MSDVWKKGMVREEVESHRKNPIYSPPLTITSVAVSKSSGPFDGPNTLPSILKDDIFASSSSIKSQITTGIRIYKIKSDNDAISDHILASMIACSTQNVISIERFHRLKHTVRQALF